MARITNQVKYVNLFLEGAQLFSKDRNGVFLKIVTHFCENENKEDVFFAENPF